MNKMAKEYPIIIQAKNNSSYDKSVLYINTIARHNDYISKKNRVYYYLEDDITKKIRTTPSKKTIELTSNVDEEIIKTLKGISGVKN